MNYYISDLHLFHEASIGFDGRPFRNLEEMHAEIVRKWNSKVTNGDTVYILGDMSMRGKNEDLIALVAILKGKKILIRGNHDDVSDLRYRQPERPPWATSLWCRYRERSTGWADWLTLEV